MNIESVYKEDTIIEFLNQYPCYKSDIWYGNDMKIAKESSRPLDRYINKIDFTLCKNSCIKNEIKYYFGKNLNDSLYSVITVFGGKAHHLRRMLKFLDKNYPNIKTILEIPKEEIMFKYTNYLIECGIKVESVKHNGTAVTPAVSLMSTFYNYIYGVFDQTPEWEKDIWDGTKLPIELNYTNTSTKRIKFTKVNHRYRGLAKKYLYTRVVELKNLTFSIGVRYLHELSIFLNFLNDSYPELSIKDIERWHIVAYLTFIKNKMIFDKTNQQKIKATDVYVSSNLSVVRKFLTDIKILDWEESSDQHIESLFLPNDNPHRTKSLSFDNPKYIPDYIWDQVVENIHLIGDRYVPIILIMEGSGFRGSDAYAKIHDQTLKEAYFKAKNKGGVKFDIEGALVKTDIDEQAIENDLELEWIRHNYDSIRMDHGMCIKSTKMKCEYAEKVIEPPCIANNCRSFHVDSSFIDYYKSQIAALEKDIQIYEKNGHVRSLEFANKKMKNYRKVLNEISDNGNINGIPKERREYVGEEREKSVQ